MDGLSAVAGSDMLLDTLAAGFVSDFDCTGTASEAIQSTQYFNQSSDTDCE